MTHAKTPPGHLVVIEEPRRFLGFFRNCYRVGVAEQRYLAREGGRLRPGIHLLAPGESITVRHDGWLLCRYDTVTNDGRPSPINPGKLKLRPWLARLLATNPRQWPWAVYSIDD